MAPNLNVVDGIERSMLLVLNNAYRLRKVALECVHHEGRIVVEAENMVKESTPIEGNLSAVPALSLPYDVWFPAHRHLLTGSEIDRTLFEGCHKLFPMSPIVPQFTQCQKGKNFPIWNCLSHSLILHDTSLNSANCLKISATQNQDTTRKREISAPPQTFCRELPSDGEHYI